VAGIRNEAERLLGLRLTDPKTPEVSSGVYRVAKRLATAAGKYDGSVIQVKNEVAKLCRSLVIPGLVIGGWQIRIGAYGLGLLLLAASGLLLALYVQLKAAHMVDLYDLSADMVRTKAKKYSAHDLTHQIRAYFWDGEQISTGLRA
jgi:hypothetical protein